MDKSVYNPRKLREEYCYSYSAEIINKISNAIKLADLNNDIPYMLYFREELCDAASKWHVDVAEIIKVFKEALALIDKYPDVECTYFQVGKDATEHLLCAYETFLNIIISFDSVSIEEYKGYLNDFRKRWTAYGCTEKEPYRMELGLCLETGDMDGAEKLWQEYKKTPANIYERNVNYITDVKYYLLNNEIEKAIQLTNGVPDGYRKRLCLEYYLVNGNYKKAEEIAYRLEHSHGCKREIMQFASFMCAYVYSRTGRGLRIYKKHWEEWEAENNPQYRYYTFKNAACFFKVLKEAKGFDVVKLKTGSPVPACSGDNIYNTDMLYKYYYKEAEEIAKRFDKRNCTDVYTKRLLASIENTCARKDKL